MKTLEQWYGGLADRERRLLGVLGIIAVAMVVIVVPYVTTWMLSDKEELNENLAQAIEEVQASRAKLQRARQAQRQLDRRYDKRAPALAGFIENAARKSELTIPESQDRAPVPHGKQFTERSTVVRMRKISLLPLVKMLETIENSGYPVMISRLNIRKRGNTPDTYDVELGVSAYDRIKPKKKSPKPDSDDNESNKEEP